ncbi:uncharacterized protein ASCRUDRAFT_10591 [Ascoidea rubescens DSM 1968]|uniref:Uncharacterized protein n=1 Tax=Ascoidea rubescens DSM 1968 TaxID=1344418 RepID=A0A1D2V8G0_9ASCO|nr:hypothetical protein ASCRUDRAFT_10591 [Ascoidea rubescens DSM 1968]ODV57981.1 hypothetical protein ASCRUDRAFT_10591 [Ascoidea rubescens DSM 1968]
MLHKNSCKYKEIKRKVSDFYKSHNNVVALRLQTKKVTEITFMLIKANVHESSSINDRDDRKNNNSDVKKLELTESNASRVNNNDVSRANSSAKLHTIQLAAIQKSSHRDLDDIHISQKSLRHGSTNATQHKSKFTYSIAVTNAANAARAIHAVPIINGAS